MSWREEARADRAAEALIELQRDEAAARLRIAARAAAAAQRRADDREDDARRHAARYRRAQWRAARLAWLRVHVTDLLFVPVIAVPGLLAWSAMASYGSGLYGWPGYLLPAFSEGGAWVFAVARTLVLRENAQLLAAGEAPRPTWHLLAGVWVFAGIGAVLNFAHGAGASPHHLQAGTGAVMAVVSAAGITAHQLVTAGPRRGREERRQARLHRAARRRVLAVRHAAVRRAVAVLDEDGGVRLVFRPGAVTVTRGRLRPAILPGLPVSGDERGGDWDRALRELTAMAGSDVTGVTVPGQDAGAAGGGVAVADRHPEPGNASVSAVGLADLVTRALAAISDGALGARPTQRELRAFLGVRMDKAAMVQRELERRAKK